MLIILPTMSRQPRTADRVAEPPAAHAIRLAERVGGHHLVEHAGLEREGRCLPSQTMW